ncbi:MAG TPA: cysteine--tRNA ligase [Bacteroidales bacterium]|nr:cysteine--tRNA ligase [Bacteroidales bacterium]HOU97595.1 cysteine--tRNA ligase [Bacteroidales bacterium]
MEHPLFIYNTLSRKKEQFVPLHHPYVGMYVCGPTVYGDPHLGHARPAIVFDVLFRYLKYLGYKVRYVRNITDVGHLENDADSGEDKIAKKARLEQLEPMEVVQYYTNRYHAFMDKMGVLRPSIEPHASGHILEQQEWIQQILNLGFAYESNGSVYFDVDKYNQKYNYGKLSGRKLEDLYATTRELDGQHEKRNPFDFALWKKASPEHIMRWHSPWSDGFPGWHLECSVMSTKYLGEEFDIHGGGMDLMFPHHECEIAQSVAAQGKDSVRYWMHNNLITINGQKMGKSLGNFITLEELFTGNNKLLSQSFHPMVIRFFILQAQYRGTLDFSNEALIAAEKGYLRLMEAYSNINKISPSATSTFNIDETRTKSFEALNDDLNTPIVLAQFFELVKVINAAHQGTEQLTNDNLASIRQLFDDVIFNILGLEPIAASTNNDLLEKVIGLILEERMQAKLRKDYEASDRIRNKLNEIGIEIKDTKNGSEWKIK